MAGATMIATGIGAGGIENRASDGVRWRVLEPDNVRSSGSDEIVSSENDETVVLTVIAFQEVIRTMIAMVLVVTVVTIHPNWTGATETDSKKGWMMLEIGTLTIRADTAALETVIRRTVAGLPGDTRKVTVKRAIAGGKLHPPPGYILIASF
jgi:hypothetical protein